MSKSKIMKRARQSFEANAKIKELFVTTDMHAFEQEHRAREHQREVDPKDKHVAVTREEALSPPAPSASAKKGNITTPKKPSAEERAKLIDQLDNIPAVERALKDESAVSVIQAGKERIAALEKAQEPEEPAQEEEQTEEK